MRILPFAITSFFLLLALNGHTQNRTEYFKAYQTPLASQPAWAQLMYSDDPCVFEVDFLYDQYFQTAPFEKDMAVRNYLHWRRTIERWVNTEGYIRPATAEEERLNYRRLKERKKELLSTNRSAAQWSCIGPMETYANGTTTPRSIQANVYAVDQSESQPDVLIAGTESGGVYKSEDRGLNWQLISTQEEFVNGITAVKIHPTDPDIIFIAGNRRIYKSTDGGQNWTESLFLDASANEIRFDPSQATILYCTASNGLYKTVDSGSNWQQVFSDACWDIDFHPTNNNVIYLLKENTGLIRQELFRSDNGGTTWTIKENGWYQPLNPLEASINGGKIGVTPASPNMVYVALIGQEKDGDDGWIGVYRSLNQGETWVNPAGQNGSPYQSANTMPWNVAAYSSGYHQGFYNFDLEVSDLNPGQLWVGTVRLSESSDSARTWIGVGGANSQRSNMLHADIQDLEVNGNEIWVASDGGLNYSTDELQTEESRKNGITAADFWGFGSGWNEDLLVGGKYHNGNSAYYQTYNQGVFMHLNGVEESTGYVSPIDSRTAYFGYSDYTDVVSVPDQLGGSFQYLGALAMRPNETYTLFYSSLLYFDPRYADHAYLGKDGTLYKSTNGGYSFSALYEFGPDDRVLEFASARSNPDVWYCVVQPGNYYWNECVIYKSTDGGSNWTLLPNIPGNRFRLEITINPEDENDIWVSSRNGANGEKVYQSTDGGATWNARYSSILAEEKPRDILFQGGTDDLVYLATDNGVFYWDGSANEWQDFSTGLPLISNTLELRPFYRDRKLRMATYGRGIYETELQMDSRPLAQPITHSNLVQCSRDTIQFDCYSILKHNGASWAWNFTPAPSYVSSLTDRNPRVVFGADGDYTVTLTVMDALGRSSSKTIDNMVSVVSECEMDDAPIMALKTSAIGDYAQSPDFAKTVSALTITAWVKPDGIQPDYSGIVINDGTTAGFNFKNGDNSLAYHWPGGQWWWNSDLIVPADEWSYVAMVMTTSGMTLYVNGESATHNINLDPVLLETMKMGSYKGWNSRNFIGEIDEVCFWDRALNIEEVRKYRHLTKENLNDPNFFAYYQFNESSGQILDKISTRHWRMNGGTSRAISSAPIGGGTSEGLTINLGGTYTSTETGITLDFPLSGTFPSGDLYLSRINRLPNELPNTDSNLGSYWIINNYGSNLNFSSLEGISFQPNSGSPSQEAIDNPSAISLYKRSDNEHLNNWLSLCTAASVDAGANGSYNFDATCGLNSFSQFFITSSVGPLPIELLTFTAKATKNQNVQLQWQAIADAQAAHYELEHAIDGRSFSSFAKHNILETEYGQSINHQKLHREAQVGANYYRLKMVDYNGAITYSPVRLVYLAPALSVNITPNPVSQDNLLQLENTTDNSVKWVLYNEAGKMMKNEVLSPRSVLQLPVDLPPGIYFYGLESRQQLSQGKLLILE